MKKAVFFLLSVFSLTAFSQTAEDAKSRMQAINNPNGVTFYNMDGYRITSEIIQNPFGEKGMKKSKRQYGLKDQPGVKDEQLGFNNLYFSIADKINDKSLIYTSYYYVDNGNNSMTLVSLSAGGKHDQNFDRNITKLIVNKQIPSECFVAMEIRGEINFAGRKVPVNGNCYWTSINTVQCPYDGEMNWSVHKSLEDAKLAVDSQMQMTKSRDVTVVSENTVDVAFENVPTKALKIVYDLNGLASVAAGMSGGKTLTAYYIAEAVRGNYVSCVMSHWNNDDIQPGGLPILLASVMTLK